jgi:uncharacterized protein (TIGR02246 family)
MRRPPFSPGTADDAEAVFYDALQNGDLERLMDCWADEDDIVCVHPGGARLVGHAAIRTAFEALFSHGQVKAHPERVRRLEAGACSVHSVIERIEVVSDDGPANAWVVATNVYVKTAQGWRLVSHHASPGNHNEPTDTLSTPIVLH